MDNHELPDGKGILNVKVYSLQKKGPQHNIPLS